MTIISVNSEYSNPLLDILYPKGGVAMNKLSLVLVIIGALNWGLVGLFNFDFVGWIFGGTGAIISRIIFTIVGLAGLWAISILFQKIMPEREQATAE